MIRKDSEALATIRELIRLAANSEEATVIGDVRTRLEDAAEKVRAENGLLPFFRKGSTKLGLDAVKGFASRVTGTMATGAVTGAIAGGPAGAIVGAAAGGIAGAGLDFLWNLATRSFDKSFKAKAERAELFVRIAQRLPASNRDLGRLSWASFNREPENFTKLFARIAGLGTAVTKVSFPEALQAPRAASDPAQRCI